MTLPQPGPEPVAVPRTVIRWGIGDVLIGLALWVLAGVLAIVLIVAVGGVDVTQTAGDSLPLGVLVVSLTSGWVGFAGWPIVATRWKGQRSLAKDFGLSIRPIDLAWGLLGGVVALAISAIAGIVWVILADEPAPSNSAFLPERPGAATIVVLVVLVALCTPVVEELFFRGLFLRSVGRRWNLTVGVVASSVVFGLLHWTGGSIGHALFIAGATAAYGAVFAILVINADGRLGPSITAHIVVNLVGVSVALLA